MHAVWVPGSLFTWATAQVERVQEEDSRVNRAGHAEDVTGPLFAGLPSIQDAPNPESFVPERGQIHADSHEVLFAPEQRQDPKSVLPSMYTGNMQNIWIFHS